MYIRHKKGKIGELKAELYFIENDYEVYKPTNDNAEYDMLINKNGIISRVSVKYTANQAPSGNWKVALSSVSRRNNSEVIIKRFDNTLVDLVVVYIAPEDRIVLVSADNIIAEREMTIS